MEDGYILTKDGEIYDLKVQISKVSENEILNLKLSKENNNEFYFLFSGSIVNLIDQDPLWKKFDLDEINEIISINCKQKKIQIKILEDCVFLNFSIDIIGKTKVADIKLLKKILEKNKTKEGTGVSEELLDSILNELSLLRRKKKGCLYHWPIDGEVHFNGESLHEFNFDMKFSSDVEFAFEFKLTTRSNCNSHLKIHLETDNTDTLEKQSYFIFNNIYYSLNSGGYMNHGMEKVKHIITNFKRGNYKMKVKFTTNSDVWFHYFKLFKKSIN